jgi:phosphate transporter
MREQPRLHNCTSACNKAENPRGLFGTLIVAYIVPCYFLPVTTLTRLENTVNAALAPSTRNSIELADLNTTTASCIETPGFLSGGAFKPDKVQSPTSQSGGRGNIARNPTKSENNQQEPCDRLPRPRLFNKHKLWAQALKHRVQSTQRRDRIANMKFSHSIQFNAVPDWSAYYIAYDNLKKL